MTIFLNNEKTTVSLKTFLNWLLVNETSQVFKRHIIEIQREDDEKKLVDSFVL